MATITAVGSTPLAQAQTAASDLSPPRWVTVVAHRGDHTAAHENSLAAIEHAVQAGADYIELDVRATGDGELVLMHDATVDRTTDGTGRVSEMTWAAVQRLVLADDSRPQLPPDRIPRLLDALGVLRGRAGLYLDFKAGSRAEVVRLLQNCQMVRSTAIYDSRDELRRWKELDPALRTMASPEPDDLRPESLATLRARLAVDILDGPATTYTPESVREARRHGFAVWPDIQGPWEQPEFWDRAIGLDADGYQSDQPGAFVEYLRRRGLRETVEPHREAAPISRGVDPG